MDTPSPTAPAAPADPAPRTGSWLLLLGSLLLCAGHGAMLTLAMVRHGLGPTFGQVVGVPGKACPGRGRLSAHARLGPVAALVAGASLASLAYYLTAVVQVP